MLKVRITARLKIISLFMLSVPYNTSGGLRDYPACTSNARSMRDAGQAEVTPEKLSCLTGLTSKRIGYDLIQVYCLTYYSLK